MCGLETILVWGLETISVWGLQISVCGLRDYFNVVTGDYFSVWIVEYSSERIGEYSSGARIGEHFLVRIREYFFSFFFLEFQLRHTSISQRPSPESHYSLVS